MAYEQEQNWEGNYSAITGCGAANRNYRAVAHDGHGGTDHCRLAVSVWEYNGQIIYICIIYVDNMTR